MCSHVFYHISMQCHFPHDNFLILFWNLHSLALARTHTRSYEIEMPNRSEALVALRAAARKLPMRTRILLRDPGSNGIIPQMSPHT
jgi:hypothetical protein